MKYIDHCPVCNGKNFTQSVTANLSSFVIDRMLGQEKAAVDFPAPASLFICGDCHYIGVNARFTPEEERRYYTDYMGEGYNAQRSRYEGSSWLQFQAHYDTPEYVKTRKQAARDMINSLIDITQLEEVLDYGGNTGNMIPDELSHAKRFVVDVEARQLVNGVKSVTSPEESGPVDLVMCCHTMEHVSYPKALLEDIKRYLKPNGCVYIEVPNEDASVNVHEHINFLTYQFLEKLLTDNGFTVLGASEINYPAPMTKSIAIVGQLK